MEFMNNLNALLVEKMGPLGPLVAVGGLGVLLVVLVLPTLLKRRIDRCGERFKRAELQRGAWCVVCRQTAGDAREVWCMIGWLCGMAVMHRGMQ